MKRSNNIDLEDLMISAATHDAWMEFVGRIAQQLRLLGVTDENQIPNEQARVNPDGSLTIFVTLPSGEVSMIVPQGHWGYQSTH